jgi:hypothetical protein
MSDVDNFDVFKDRAISLLERWEIFRNERMEYTTPQQCIRGFLLEINDGYTEELMKSNVMERSDLIKYYEQLRTEALMQVRTDPEYLRLFANFKWWMHFINIIAPFDQIVLWRTYVWRKAVERHREKFVIDYIQKHSHDFLLECKEVLKNDEKRVAREESEREHGE